MGDFEGQVQVQAGGDGGSQMDGGAADGAATGGGASSGDGGEGGAASDLDVMADVLDMAGTSEPALMEPGTGRPKGAEAGGADGNIDELSAQTKKDDSGADGAKKPKADEGSNDEQLVEVATDDGVKKVPLKNLVTTYTQHKHLQSQHERIKPIFDLAKKAGVPVENTIRYLALGIQVAKNAKRTAGGVQVPVGSGGGSVTPAGADGYRGPFKSADEDARMKDIDPSLHATVTNLFNQNTRLNAAVQSIAGRMKQGDAASRQSRQREALQHYKGVIDQKITDFAGGHKDYFAVDPQTGTSERLDAFKRFLGNKYGHLDIDKDLTPEMLTIAFQTFDPQYVSAFMVQQARDRNQRLLAQERSTFGESNNTRAGSQVKQLDDQQEIMADLV